MFTNPHARMLTLCSSGRHAQCARVARLLFDDVGAGKTKFTVEEYEAGEETILPGAGCWEATFPALGSNIAALVAAAVPIIDGLIVGPRPSHGTAIVLRRNELRKESNILASLPPSLVEVAWAVSYR